MKNAVKELERAKYLLSKKKDEVKELREELVAKEQIIQMLSSFILEGVEKKGRVEISKEEISKGLKSGYRIEAKENKYVLTKSEKTEC